MTFTKVTSRGIRDGNIGIRTTGGFVGTGFTVLNFVGAGNTFAISGDGTTIDISIAGGGGGGGSSGDEIYKEAFNVLSTTSTFTLTTGQFDEGFLDVYVNGIKIPPEDFTETPPNQFTLLVAAESGDVVEVIANRTRSTNTTLNADVTNLNASGIVTAGQFYGSGRNLTNLPVGIGTILDINTPGLDSIYYVNTTLGIGQSITVNPPSSATSSFTHYTEIAVDPDVDFIVEDGDDFIADILGLGELEVPNLPGNGGRVRADNFTNKAGTGAPNFPNGINVSGGVTVSGIVTASGFSGNVSSATYAITSGIATYATSAGIATYAISAGIATNVIGGISSVTQIQVTGISTFSNGPVLVGSATSTGTATQRLQVTGGSYVSGSVGIGTTNPSTTLQVQGSSSVSDTRLQSVCEETTLINGNTASLVYNTGGGNVAICTNASGDITLAVTGIPTDSTFNNNSITFSVFSLNTGVARSCTAVTLNGFNATIRWAGGSLAAASSGLTTTTGMDIYSFTGINTVGSASTTANYYVLGVVNGGYR